MIGRKLDYKKEFAWGFGDLIIVNDPKVLKGSMAPRAQEAIALYPTGNISEAWVMLHKKSGKRIVRS